MDQVTLKANESTASLIEEERIIAKLSIKTLSDRTIKLDFIDKSLTLSQLKEQLVNHVEIGPQQQFFLLSGKVYGDSLQSSSEVKIVDLPGFKAPELVIEEFKSYEEKRKAEAEGDSLNDSGENSSQITIVKGIEELLPTLYLFHYEPSAKLLDPLDSATDWDAKNRLKFFKGIWGVAQRDLEVASKYLIEALPTFEENGCMPYKDLVKYAVITASVALDRPSLKSKVSELLSKYIASLFRLYDHRKCWNASNLLPSWKISSPPSTIVVIVNFL